MMPGLQLPYRVTRLPVMLLVGLLPGCVATSSTRVTEYDIHAHLVPEEHHLIGRATLQVEQPRRASGSISLDLTLNEALTVKRISSPDAEIVQHTVRALREDSAAGATRRNAHRIVVGKAPKSFSITVEYFGALVQDTAAGERPGQIHNFLMAAHIGPDGIYLEPTGGWYPMPRRAPGSIPPLAGYRLTAARVDDMALAASATLEGGAADDAPELRWTSARPMDGLVLVGGPHQVKARNADGIRLALHYTPEGENGDRERNTDLFFAASADYLRRYQPLIGPYPFEQFTIVENFFSSGFAFPQMTLLSGTLLDMGPKALKHGYLDHELLHNWWGNAVYVDPTDGNWCEALASYGANYYGYVLDGDAEGARRQRRDCCNFLSRIKPADDKPLGTFGRPKGAGRSIGYSKGTMVFHMLARTVGQERFWAALRELTAEHTGRYANWATLQGLFERHGGQPLDRFFAQWVRGSGAPALALDSAQWNVDTRILETVIHQGEPPFSVDVPLRFEYEDRTVDHIVEVNQATQTVRIPLESAPQGVLLDPDYHVFRKLQPQEVMPTTAITRSAAAKLLVVMPSGELAEGYQTVVDQFAGAGSPPVRVTIDTLDAASLNRHSVLILGSAAADPRVTALLDRTICPVRWRDGGFEVDGHEFGDPSHAVLCTVHHPDVTGGGITVYAGNSSAALGRSDLLLFYSNSLLVFATTEDDAEVVLRRDFESVERVSVTQ